MVIPDYITFKKSNELYHYGIKGKSGRYPLGSGERPYQDYPEKRQKLSDEEINKKITEINKATNIKEEAALYKKGYAQAKELYPTKAKILAPQISLAVKITNKMEAKYSKKFDELMDELSKSGVELETVKDLKFGNDFVWTGTKYVRR